MVAGLGVLCAHADLAYLVVGGGCGRVARDCRLAVGSLLPVARVVLGGGLRRRVTARRRPAGGLDCWLTEVSKVCFLPKTLNTALPSFSIPLTHSCISARVAAISTMSAISPIIRISASRASSGASKAGTTTLQKTLAATSRAVCSTAGTAASLAASLAFYSSLALVGAGSNPLQSTSAARHYISGLPSSCRGYWY